MEDASKKREEVFKEWSSWLVERDLDRHLSPLATEKIGDKVSAIKVRMVQRESIDERLDEMSKTIGEVSSRISKVAPFLKNFIVDSNIPTSIQVIYRHFDETRVLREKKENLEAQLRGINEKINTLKRKVE